MAAMKIATCCYCGTKAALILRGKNRHELSCGNCGAPLRSLKMLPVNPERSRATTPYRSQKHDAPRDRDRVVARPKKHRKGKSFGRRIFSEIWDVVEDLVEDVFD